MSCFDKIKELMVEIDRKVTSNAKDQRRSCSVLPTWGNIYRSRDLPSSHTAAPLNPQYSRLLNKTVPYSRYVSLSLEDCARLESCLRGLVGSQSYPLWAMASLFTFLRDTSLFPSDDGFNKVVSSLSVALTAQAKALYAASVFLKQVRRETYVAHLPAHTHDSVKRALLSTPSEESLFSEEVIQRSLGKFGMTHSYSCCGICRPRGVRRVRPPLLLLLLSDVVALQVRNRLLPPLRGTLSISLAVRRATNVRLLLLQLVVR